jgi:2-(1,2-epoxy-1,2-dihydrophenyl)acetyl-CoA isomerase
VNERLDELKERTRETVDKAKGRVGMGDPPLASEVGGRIEAVREALRAFGQGDIDRFLSAFDEDAEWVAPKGSKFPGAGTKTGPQAIREGFAGSVKRTYATFGFEPDHFLDVPGERSVVVIGTFAGEAAEGGGRVDAPAVQVWSFDRNRVLRVQTYADSEDFAEPVDAEEKETQ